MLQLGHSLPQQQRISPEGLHCEHPTPAADTALLLLHLQRCKGRLCQDEANHMPLYMHPPTLKTTRLDYDQRADLQKVISVKVTCTLNLWLSGSTSIRPQH
jgi:hypothetical protein